MGVDSIRMRLLVLAALLLLLVTGCDSMVEYFVQNDSAQPVRTGWMLEGDCTLEAEARHRTRDPLEVVPPGETLRVSGSAPQSSTASCVVIKDDSESNVLLFPFEPSKTYVIDASSMASSQPALPATGEGGSDRRKGPLIGGVATIAGVLAISGVILAAVRWNDARRRAR